MNTKIFSIFLIVILIVNMVLFALQRINALIFWGTIIICAAFAYLVLPKLK
ncbi:MAG: hypothetical protein KJ601_00470 [Nanoarchaeota archaeon]|nr:hypothetical protein [Nanoarchaeota archaeon]MBU1704547.1 hypothetical protein [Nanoarchaeota archaeon]